MITIQVKDKIEVDQVTTDDRYQEDIEQPVPQFYIGFGVKPVKKAHNGRCNRQPG